MSCSFNQDLLQEYIENTIEPLEKIFLQEHLKVCKICRRELTELKLLLWEMERISSVELPHEVKDIKEAVLDIINEELNSVNKPKNPSRFKKYVALQSNILNASSTFYKFIPGANKASKAFDAFVVDRFKSKVKKSISIRGIL